MLPLGVRGWYCLNRAERGHKLTRGRLETNYTFKLVPDTVTCLLRVNYYTALTKSIIFVSFTYTKYCVPPPVFLNVEIIRGTSQPHVLRTVKRSILHYDPFAPHRAMKLDIDTRSCDGFGFMTQLQVSLVWLFGYKSNIINLYVHSGVEAWPNSKAMWGAHVKSLQVDIPFVMNVKSHMSCQMRKILLR